MEDIQTVGGGDGADPGPNVAPAAIPAPTVHVLMVAVAWTMSPPPSSEVSQPYIQELVRTSLSMA